VTIFSVVYVRIIIIQTFQSFDVESSFVVTREILREYGSSSYMKVIGSRSSHRSK